MDLGQFLIAEFHVIPPLNEPQKHQIPGILLDLWPSPFDKKLDTLYYVFFLVFDKND